MEFKRLEEVKKLMDSIVHIDNFDADLIQPSVAFTLKKSALIGDIYKIYVNNSNQDAANALWMHEAGHIIYNHIGNEDVKNRIIRQAIREKYNEFKEKFPNEESFCEYIMQRMFNLVMDMEVNSKLFSKEEFDYLEKLISDLLGSETKAVWPERYGFPVGKTWKEYLYYALQDFDKFIDDMSDQDENSNQGDNQSESQNENQGENQSSKSELGEPSNGDFRNISPSKKPHSGKKLDKKAINKIKKAVDNELSSIKESIASEIEGSYTRSESGASSIAKEDNTMSLEDVSRYISKHIFNNVIVNDKNDLLYNANRGKLGMSNQVLTSKFSREYTFKPDDFIVIVDVSGSVKSSFVSNVMEMFSKMSRAFGKKSRLILWNIDLVRDYCLTDKNLEPYSGGGTYIARGIEYAAENYGSNKKIFIVSDFEDDLSDWTSVIKRFNLRQVYGLDWKGKGEECKSLLNVLAGYMRILY